MTKHWFAGAAALAMLAGVAAAQTTIDTTISKTVIAPAAGTVSSSKTQTTVKPDGTQTDKTQTYDSGSGGASSSSSTKTTAPDGSQENSWRQEWTSPRPAKESNTSTTTTTTTIPR
jgi:hypothetical protein